MIRGDQVKLRHALEIPDGIETEDSGIGPVAMQVDAVGGVGNRLVRGLQQQFAAPQGFVVARTQSLERAARPKCRNLATDRMKQARPLPAAQDVACAREQQFIDLFIGDADATVDDGDSGVARCRNDVSRREIALPFSPEHQLPDSVVDTLAQLRERTDSTGANIDARATRAQQVGEKVDVLPGVAAKQHVVCVVTALHRPSRSASRCAILAPRRDTPDHRFPGARVGISIGDPPDAPCMRRAPTKDQ